MREIVLDTETTGLDPASGHRLVEIAGVEIINFIPSGQTFHVYLDPQRDMPEEAFRVHGLSLEFLSGKPLFHHVAPDFLTFIADAQLVIHNAEFDVRFLNAELKAAGHPLLDMSRVLDTLGLARRKHPGASNSLDALCARYRIDNSRRTKHGALLDAEILAEVYMELTGGRQATLILASEIEDIRPDMTAGRSKRPAPLTPRLDAAELEQHRQFLGTMHDKNLWRDCYGV